MKIPSTEWWLELVGLVVLIVNVPIQNPWIDGVGLAILTVSTLMDGLDVDRERHSKD